MLFIEIPPPCDASHGLGDTVHGSIRAPSSEALKGRCKNRKL